MSTKAAGMRVRGRRRTNATRFLLLLALGPTAPIHARPGPTPPACPGGRFLAYGDPIVPDAGTVAGSVVSITPTRDGFSVALPTCDAVVAETRTGSKGLRIDAVWPPCAGSQASVHLVGHLATCDRFVGTLERTFPDRVRRRQRRRIRATISRCGDGIIDPGRREQCDGGPGCDPATCRLDPGGTGAIGIVTVGGVQKLYLPLTTLDSSNGHGVISVIDVGAPGAAGASVPALIADIDLPCDATDGPCPTASATAGNGDTVVATGTGTRNVWFIDPKTDTVTDVVPLDDTVAAPGKAFFSGEEGCAGTADEGVSVSGVGIDTTSGRAILAVWDGFVLVDLAPPHRMTHITAAPSENFGLDTRRGRIVAPFYACRCAQGPDGNPPAICDTYKASDGKRIITDGVNLIEVGREAVSTLVPRTASPSGGGASAPLGVEPDAAAVDPGLELAVVPLEGASPPAGLLNIVDLGLGKVDFDRSRRSFSAPVVAIETRPRLTGVAIEPTSHYVFLEEEFGSNVGVLKLDRSFTGLPRLVTGVAVPPPPGETEWKNLGDPHGIAVTTDVAGGLPFGFVVNERRTYVARVDLGLLASSAAIDTAITYLSTRERSSVPVTTASTTTSTTTTTRPSRTTSTIVSPVAALDCTPFALGPLPCCLEFEHAFAAVRSPDDSDGRRRGPQGRLDRCLARLHQTCADRQAATGPELAAAARRMEHELKCLDGLGGALLRTHASLDALVGGACETLRQLQGARFSDLDRDGIRNACDSDIDGDGVVNLRDNCMTACNRTQDDADGDGVGDECDVCPGTKPEKDVDQRGCSAGQAPHDDQPPPAPPRACS